MNVEEIQAFLAERKESNAAQHFDLDNLHCYGCAHSASTEPYPGKPSGERPCCSCVRNKDRELWLTEHPDGEDAIVLDNEGHAHIFDPFRGTQYNGGPLVRFPMDNYVTLDQRAQESFLAKHPEYSKGVTVSRDGIVTVIDGG